MPYNNEEEFDRLDAMSTDELTDYKDWLEEDANGQDSSGANMIYAFINWIIELRQTS